MHTIHLDDLDDPRLSVYRRLKKTNATRNLGLFVVEGDKLVERLLASRFPVVSLLASDRWLDRLPHGIPTTAAVYVVNHELMQQAIGFAFHRGLLACGERLPEPTIAKVLADAPARSAVLLAPEVQDPENLGALARVAAAFGVRALVAGPSAPDPLSRRALRVSMGATLALPVLRPFNVSAAWDWLEHPWRAEFVAAVLDEDAAPLSACPRPDRLALAVGHEAHGLSAVWRERCRRLVTIPMAPGVDSLNVALAAGICLYHFVNVTD